MELNQNNQIAQLIQSAEVLLILTGAGMSADSGIPTYRGEDGTWGKWEEKFEKPITELMTPQFIQENPVYMWKRFAKGFANLKNIEPHIGYHILFDWVQRFDLQYFTITSNVDGLLQKAGFSPEKVYEVHGASGYLQCTLPCWDKIWQMDYSIYNDIELSENSLPRCPNCGNLVRPNVYIFKDKTFVSNRIREQKARLDDFLVQNKGKKTILIEIGAGATVKTIRHLTNRFIREQNAQVIRINPEEKTIEQPHLLVAETALEALQRIDKFLKV